jgi:hypothetical protein
MGELEPLHVCGHRSGLRAFGQMAAVAPLAQWQAMKLISFG